MNNNFELSSFFDKLREEKKISYEDYLKYRGMADILEMENERLQKECDSKEEAYNKCYEDYRFWKNKANEYERATKDIEKAFEKYLEKKACRFCSYRKLNYCEATKENQKDCFSATIETYIKQIKNESNEENQKTVLTNRQWLETFTDEELAVWLNGFNSCNNCIKRGNDCFPYFDMEEWLKREHK